LARAADAFRQRIDSREGWVVYCYSSLKLLQAAAIHLAKIRAIVRDLAEEAHLREPEKFAQAWHMLMKGSIVSSGEGNRNAARDAK
jgi:hypothetical protein